MVENALDDLDLSEEEQAELNNEAPTNEAETNEAETNETQEAEKSADSDVEANIDNEYEDFKNRWSKKSPDEIID